MSHVTGYTGRLFEEEVLGTCVAASTGEYLTYGAAMEAARKGQPPMKSPTRVRIERELRLLLGDAVRVRTAVGSVLDKKHGVDAFVDFDGVVVTIDITLNPNKEEHKADMVVREDDLVDLRGLAQRIARIFEMRLRAPALPAIATTRRVRW